MLPHPAPLLYWYQNHWHMMVLAESPQKAFCKHHPVCWSLYPAGMMQGIERIVCVLACLGPGRPGVAPLERKTLQWVH
jgi:hypothetical protein